MILTFTTDSEVGNRLIELIKSIDENDDYALVYDYKNRDGSIDLFVDIEQEVFSKCIKLISEFSLKDVYSLCGSLFHHMEDETRERVFGMLFPEKSWYEWRVMPDKVNEFIDRVDSSCFDYVLKIFRMTYKELLGESLLKKMEEHEDEKVRNFSKELRKEFDGRR